MRLFACHRILLIGFTGIFLFAICLNAGAKGFSQQVSISEKDVTLEKIFKEINIQTGYTFFYIESLLKGKKVSMSLHNASLEKVLDVCFKDQPITYTLLNKRVIIQSKLVFPDNDYIATPPPPVNISGKVTNNKGEPLQGVSVLIAGSKKGTTTNSDGRFVLSVPNAENIVLEISNVGYKIKIVKVGKQTEINITLEEAVAGLDQMVVVGYGTRRKSDLTGAVGSVRAAQLQERPAPSLNQALAGRISGVQVNTNSGRPGGRTNIRVRGFSSINSSNNPLYVVDGVLLPVSNQAQASQAIDYINPNDIVSVEVLKDASSTAIYGARGANGVILITTKRGKAGESRITYDADFSVPKIGPNFPRVLNAKEFLAVEDLAYKNMEKYDPAGWAAGRYVSRNPALARTDPRVFDAKGNPLFDTDWLAASTQHKISQNHQIGFSGGNEATTYSVSMGYRDDEGLLLTSYLKRYSGRFSFDSQIKPWMKVGGTMSYNNQEENIVDQSDAVPRQIVEDFPFLPVRYADGTFANNRDYPNAEGTMSSVHRLLDTRYIMNTQTSLGNVYSNITFAPGLELRTIVGFNVLTQGINQSVTRTLNIGGSGNASASNRRESFWSLENYLTYNKRFKEIHSFTGLLGISAQETNAFSENASINGFSSDYFLYNNLGAGSTGPGYGSSRSRFAFNSYFGRINYGLKDKYLFTITARADGSSKFGANNKYSLFPSGALAWRVSEEDFLKNSRTISNLKIRTSYGLTGNSEIPAYSSLSLLSSNYSAVINGQKVGGTGINRLANPDLKWEKTAQYDAGLELGLFGNRINLEADFYYRKTTDMLLDAPVPRTSGYATIRKNVGSM